MLSMPTADAPLTPSKSQRKRDAHALQALGVQLVALSAAQLARLDLPEILHLTNRTYVMYQGMMRAELKGSEITEAAILSEFFESRTAVADG